MADALNRGFCRLVLGIIADQQLVLYLGPEDLEYVDRNDANSSIFEVFGMLP